MLQRFVRNFRKDEAGGVLVYTAFASAVMFGMVGLSLELGMWYQTKRDMQSAADAAAMAAVLEMARGATATEIETRAKALALLNGYTASEVTINNPPLSGDYAGNPAFIEAVVAQDQPGLFSSVVTSSDMPIMARAVSTLAGAPSCVIALNPTADAALEVKGNTDVNLDCGAQANSTSATAVQGGKAADLTASSIQSSGGYDCSNCTPLPQENMPPMNDPFAYLTPPAIGPCDEPAGSPFKYGSSDTGIQIPPGNYCGGIEIGGADVNFQAGVFILGGVGLQINGNATVTNDPDGVTFYFDPSATGTGGSLLFVAGSTTVVLSAPTTGIYDGILFYVDPAVDPTKAEVNLTGGTDMELTGVVYAPNMNVEYSGNASSSGTWTSIVADTVLFSGNSHLSSAGFVGGNLPLALSAPSLAE